LGTECRNTFSHLLMTIRNTHTRNTTLVTQSRLITTMLILGFNGGTAVDSERDDSGISHHDSAAVIIRDGEIVAAVEEERLSRLKHTNCFPVNAIRYCLSATGCTLEDIDLIATNNSEHTYDSTAKLRFINDATQPVFASGRSYLGSRFDRVFGADVEHKLFFCEHHLAHAWSVFGLAGFDRSLVVSIDGDGDNSSGLVLDGADGHLTKICDLSIDQSLGRMYEGLIRLLGFSYFDEYKAMGLAPYGNPNRFKTLFEKCYTLLPDGRYRLAPMTTWLAHLDGAGLIRQARRKGAEFSDGHADFAAALQCALETIVLHLLRHFREVTGHCNLSLAGGVAHNCSLNGRILESGLFDNIFVQPAAHDAGGALGAAICAYQGHHGHGRLMPMTHVYLGPDTGQKSEVKAILDSWSAFLDHRDEPDVEAATATLLEQGAVVGWVQGRAEFGPRALGNRSILADPRPAANKTRINEMVKKREGFRPFAPSILVEAAGDYFDIPGDSKDLPYMIFVVGVQSNYREQLGAVTHVDGTARIQTVSRNDNPRYWRLISEFSKLTGTPVLLNTSFNNNAEPIVTSVDDAIGCYLTTGIDFLIVDDFIVVKKDQNVIRDSIITLRLKLPNFVQLVRRRDPLNDTAVICELECTKDPGFGFPSKMISSPAYDLLRLADGVMTVHQLFSFTQNENIDRSQLLSELVSLWADRSIILRP
jgi:carbamoyltransferase